MCVVALVVLSVAIRIGYYVEAKDSPLLYGHLWSQADMGFFEHWAKVIVDKDPLGRNEIHPFFDWQTEPAAQHFHAHPEQVAVYERAGVAQADTKALHRALWDHWTHGKEYYQEPLYVYLIALTYKFFGPFVRAVFVWQMALGVCTNLLVYFFARHYFGEIAGAISGLLIVLYSPLFFYDLTLLRTTLTAFLAAVAVMALERSLASDSWRRWMITGLAVGIAMTCQFTFVVFLVGSVGLIWVKFRPSSGRVLRLAAATLCGSALAVSPVIARNIAVGAPPFSWAGAGVWTFIRFNTPSAADPRLGPVAPVFPDHIRILSESDAKALPAVRATLREHTPASLARLVWMKFQKMWNWYEESDNVDFYYSRLYSDILRYAPVTNALIAPLLLVGLGFYFRQWKRYAPLYLLAGNGIFVMLLTFPTGRYRVAYLAVLIPLAGAVLAELLTRISWRQFRKVLILGGVLLVVGLWTSAPLPAPRRLIRTDFYLAPVQYYWTPVMDGAVARQNWSEATRIMARCIRVEPEDLGAASDPQLIRMFALAHGMKSEFMQKSGDAAGAAGELSRYNQLARLLSR